MKHTRTPHKNRGFTLLELLFVIGIFSVLTAVVVFNYGNFNNNIIMSNLAYEVALEIRQAQVYSLGVRAVSGLVGGDERTEFNTRYGVFFDIGQGGSNINFLSFADFYPESPDPNNIDVPDGNGFCDSDENDRCDISLCTAGFECLQSAQLVRGITFETLCVAPEGTEPVDIDNGECGYSEVESLHITFARPYTDAIIRTSDDTDETEVTARNAAIILKSTAGSRRAVIIKSTGQISVVGIAGAVQ